MAQNIRAPPAKKKVSGTYTHEEANGLKERAERATSQQLRIAADWLASLFKQNEIPFAFMGGFALQVRGSARDTFDVDVAVGCNMRQLIAALEPQSIVLRPLGPVSGVMRIFVEIGGITDVKMSGALVEVDIILQGSLGAPEEPESASELVSIGTSDGQREYRILNLKSIVDTKLGAAFRRSGKNDMDDLVFLIGKYAEQISEVSKHFKHEHRQHFINLLRMRKAPQGMIKNVQKVLAMAGNV